MSTSLISPGSGRTIWNAFSWPGSKVALPQ